MIVLDTNVISEFMKQTPHAGVVAWLDAQNEPEVYLTAITAMELYLGVAPMPEGKNKRSLQASVQSAVALWFKGKILPFNERAAAAYARIVAARKASGRPISVEDALIASICVENGATLATRNVRDFIDTGIPLVNPWEYARA